MLKIGDNAPDFEVKDHNDTVKRLHDYKGKWLLMYFYPKDDTPGCTKEACGFRDSFSKLKSKVTILGISADTVKSHQKFVEKYGLPFTLLSDPDKTMIKAYKAWGKKKFMGREYDGIFRISYLIDPKGKIAKVYPEVKPDKHATEIMEDIA